MSIRHIYEAGDTVIVEGDYSGTQTGDLVGAAGTIPATGRSFSFPFADVFTVAGGKVVRHAIYWDNMAVPGPARPDRQARSRNSHIERASPRA